MTNIAPIGSKNLYQARPLLYVAGLVGAWVIARVLITLATTPANDTNIKWLKPIQISDNDYVGVNINPSADISPLIPSAQPSEHRVKPSQFSAYLGFDSANPNAASFANITARQTFGGGPIPNSIESLLFFNGLTERNAALKRPNARVPPNIWTQNSSAVRNAVRNRVDHNNPSLLANGLIADLDANRLAGRNAAKTRHNLSSRLSAYAYIFARSGDGNADALGARYGGSQAAFQAAYRINTGQKNIWQATVRAQTALGSNDSEIAAGVRYKPNEKFPIAVVAERRLRLSSPDGYALYAAGGKSAIDLPVDFKLDVYGQAGLSTAGPDTLFFDGSANVQRPVHSAGNVTISAGGGAWTGGQSGVTRLDVGPSVSVTVSTAKKNFRISGDWRERVSGNATPSSGAAITLSTDF